MATDQKLAYRQCFEEIKAILTRHDPIGIIFEVNIDEYDLEVGTILPRLATAHSIYDVRHIVHEEFLRWFGKEAGGIHRYKKIAEEIWIAWQRSPLRSHQTHEPRGE